MSKEIINIFCRVIAMLMLLLHVSCDKSSRDIVSDMTWEYKMPAFEIVKFDDAEDCGKVVTVRKGEDFCIRGTRTVADELCLRTSPYISLPDGYRLVDWKWGLLFDSQAMLLNVSWDDLEDSQQCWNANGVYHEKFVGKLGYVSRGEIDKFLKINPSPADRYSKIWGGAGENSSILELVSLDYAKPWWLYGFQSLSEMPDTLRTFGNEIYTKADYMAEVARQDSLQDVYVLRLSTIIERGEEGNLIYFYK